MALTPPDFLLEIKTPYRLIELSEPLELTTNKYGGVFYVECDALNLQGCSRDYEGAKKILAGNFCCAFDALLAKEGRTERENNLLARYMTLTKI